MLGSCDEDEEENVDDAVDSTEFVGFNVLERFSARSWLPSSLFGDTWDSVADANTSRVVSMKLPFVGDFEMDSSE